MSDIVNARDHGMVPTASAADNVNALRAAYADAQAKGWGLYIPAGSYNLDQTMDAGVGILHITSNISIIGDGMTRTILNVQNLPSGASGIAFYVMLGMSPIIKNLSLNFVGSLGNSQQDEVGAKILRGIHAFGDGSVTTLENVKMAGWYTAVRSNGIGIGSAVKIRNCELRAKSSVVTLQVGTVSTNSYLEAFDSIIEQQADGFVGFHPVVMAHTGVSYKLHRITCNRSGSEAYAFYYSGVGQQQGLPITQNFAAEVIDCYFGDQVFHGIHLAASAVPVVYRGGVNRARGAQFLVGGQSIIDGVTFCSPKSANGTANTAIDDEKGFQGDIQVSNCVFTKEASADGFGHVVRRHNGKVWQFAQCDFGDCNSAPFNGYGIATNGVPYPPLGNDPAPITLFTHCTFSFGAGTVGFLASRGRWFFTHCVFKGMGCSIECTQKPDFTPPVIELSGCVVAENINLLNCYNSGGGVATVHVRDLRGNPFHIWALPASAATKFIGTFRPLPGNATATFVSTGTNVWRLILGHQGSIYDINQSGMPMINELWMQGAATGIQNNIFVNGHILQLRVKAPFTLGSTGNIIATSGVRVINSVVTLLYSTDAGKWLEV